MTTTPPDPTPEAATERAVTETERMLKQALRAVREARAIIIRSGVRPRPPRKPSGSV